MEDKALRLFLKIRESFGDIKEKVSLSKPYFELIIFSPGWAMKIEQYEKILGFKPEFIYKSNEEVYAISVFHRIDDDVTTGIIAHGFAEIIARENSIMELKLIDKICVEKGFGVQLLHALENDVLPGMAEREFVDREDLIDRINNLKSMMQG
jgi:hypothetical protein